MTRLQTDGRDRNVDQSTLAIVDELGRGTSSRDGLAIAVAISEALLRSGSTVWFATHFHQLGKLSCSLRQKRVTHAELIGLLLTAVSSPHPWKSAGCAQFASQNDPRRHIP